VLYDAIDSLSSEGAVSSPNPVGQCINALSEWVNGLDMLWAYRGVKRQHVVAFSYK
jgi:hypothetical protein